MIKRYAFVLIFVFFTAALLYQPATAKEDTAQIKLKKTAEPSKKIYTYPVKEGDTLFSIVNTIPGITEEDLSNDYQLIKELNPNIPNLDKLEAGQSLNLPWKPLTGTEGIETEYKTIAGANKIYSGPKYYLIKRGDTLFKIILRELKSETNIAETLKTIKSINPSIKNVNRIYAGAVIRLPGEYLFVKTAKEIKPVAQKETETLSKISNQPEKIIEIKEKIVMPPEARLAVLKHVIVQMNGSITTTGNYYLPIPQAGQVTIDCSKIPLIEFDDNTTVFIDLENRAHDNLKKMILNNWKNYYLVKVDKNDDVFTILEKVINTTKSYRMMKSEKPLMAGTVPLAEVMVDWVIVKSLPHQHPQTIQGLRSIYENNLLLPRSIKDYYQNNGLIITEISGETGLAEKPEEIYSLSPVPVFPTTSVKDFSYALITDLGLNAEKDVDIQIFDTVKDGFNLSIKADVLVRNGDKKYIISSQNFSQQFINALKQAGNEPIFISDSDSPKNNMENILRGINIPFNSDNFTFSGLSKNQAPYTLKFSGTKIKTNQDLYVVDFDIDQGLRGLLQEVWSANIAKY
ncbi:MAG: LysM peptidoglycan-binding domain-containing protein [Smithella sp.]